MEKVRQWCGQPSDLGRLKNRTEPLYSSISPLFVFIKANKAIINTVNQWRIQDFCKGGGAAAGAFGVPQAPSCPLSLRPLRKFRGS